MTTRSNLISARVLNGGALYAHLKDFDNPHQVAVDGVTISGGGTATDPLKIFNAADGKSYVNVDGAWVEIDTTPPDLLLEFDVTVASTIIDFTDLPYYPRYDVNVTGLAKADGINYASLVAYLHTAAGRDIIGNYNSTEYLYMSHTSSAQYVNTAKTSFTFTSKSSAPEKWDLFLSLRNMKQSILPVCMNSDRRLSAGSPPNFSNYIGVHCKQQLDTYTKLELYAYSGGGVNEYVGHVSVRGVK